MKRPSFPLVLRFRLQTLLVLMTVFAIALGLVLQEWNREHRRKQIATDIKRLGGHVSFVHPRLTGNKASGVVNGWLRIFLGDEYFTVVDSVALKPQAAEDLDRVHAFPEMTRLGLSGPAVTDDALPRLRGLSQLQRLKLNGAILSGKGLESLAELPLGELEFDKCSLTEESLKSLARATDLSNLRHISFTNCALTDADLQAMHGARSSVNLSLRMTNVTEAGMLALREANPRWSIRFRDPLSGHSNASESNYLPSIQETPQTEKLAYQSPLITSATLAVLKDATSLSKLELKGCRLADGDLEQLRPLQNLEWLTIEDIPITDKGLRALKELTKLRTLVLIRTNVNGTGVGELAPGIKSLHLVTSEVTDEGVTSVAKLNSLESLGLVGTMVSDEAAKELAKMTRLRTLSVRETAISASAVSRLQRALPDCEIFTQ